MKKELEEKLKKVLKMLTLEAKKNKKNSIYIYGKTGVGKTTLLNYLYENGIKAKKRKIVMSDFFEKLLKEQKENVSYSDTLDFYKKQQILFIDDFGVERYSEWKQDIVYNILNYRYENNLRTFLTSNLNLKEVEEKYNDRISSRLKGMCYVRGLVGEDKRK